MGWGYADWEGVFYPPGISGHEQIAVYAQTFDTVEIDSTFYGIPRPQQVESWYRATPPGFLFCPKMPKEVTHTKRLLPSSYPEVRRFVEVMGILKEKLGPILLQMPPDFDRSDLPALMDFLPLLQTFRASLGIRFAMEFRHRSLNSSDISAMLSRNAVALAAVDYVIMPPKIALTTDFLYVRLIGRHGAFPRHTAVQANKEAALMQWAQAIRKAIQWKRNADFCLEENKGKPIETVYIFCNNDYEGFSPATCNKVRRLMGLEEAVFPVQKQQTLFGEIAPWS